MSDDALPAIQTAKLSAVVFDFETEQFDDNFRNASTRSDRLKHSPILRVACIYDLSTRKYSFYEPKSVRKLIERLCFAEKMISFNGKNFDLLVLLRHYGLSPCDVEKFNAKHVDLCEEVKKVCGELRSLNSLSKLNLGERKRVEGRSMASLTLDDLKSACRSDVRQTYGLFKKLQDGTLKIPGYWGRDQGQTSSRGTPRTYKDDEHDLTFTEPGSELFLPDLCPACGVENTLFDLPPDRANMTEGQEAEYMAGFSLNQICGNCALFICDGEPLFQSREILKRTRNTKPWVFYRARISHTYFERYLAGRDEPIKTSRREKPNEAK